MAEDRLTMIDDIRKRINVSHRQAEEALKEAGDDVLKAVMILEDRYPETIDSIKNTAQKTVETLKEIPYIRISKDKDELIGIPAVVGAALLYGGIRRPKLLAAVLGIGAVAGLDVSLTYGDKELSLRETLRLNTRKASESIQKTRTELENKIFDNKDKNFLKEDKSGERYHTIRL